MAPVTVIHDVHFDHPRGNVFSDAEGKRNLEIYVNLQQETCYDYRAQPSYKTLYADAEQSFEKLTVQRLKRGMELKDAPSTFEMCIRYVDFPSLEIRALYKRLVGPGLDGSFACAGPMKDLISLRDAYRNLVKIAHLPQDDEPSFFYNCDKRLKLRSFATMAWAMFQGVMMQPNQSFAILQSSRPLEDCLMPCDLLASVNFIPPIVLRVACWVSTIPARFGVDNLRNVGVFRLEDLWRAYDSYIHRQDAMERTRVAIASRASNKYQCAAEGCGIQTFERRAFRKCGGNCDPETKPRYCSANCQAKHWFFHRYVCKKKLAVPFSVDDGDRDWEDVDVYHPGYNDGKLEDCMLFAERIGPEIFVDIPNPSPYRRGEVYRIKTRTMSPAFLRSYRDLWKQSPRVRKQIEYALSSDITEPLRYRAKAKVCR